MHWDYNECLPSTLCSSTYYTKKERQGIHPEHQPLLYYLIFIHDFWFFDKMLIPGSTDPLLTSSWPPPVSDSLTKTQGKSENVKLKL